MEHVFTLLMLVMLQAVLGFDNLLYISLESKRAPEDKQGFVRKLGIGLAIALRIGLLFVILEVMDSFKAPFWSPKWEGYIEGKVNLESFITLGGGVFIIYTAVKEIWHMLRIENDPGKEQKPASVGKVVSMIVIMNLVFSFDSILSAKALTDNRWLMTAAIVISGALMIWLADKVSTFLKKNRMYEVLGLFILFIVGIMLVTEGGHQAELSLFGNHITPMTKTTFYFVIFILVVIDIVQTRYQKKLLKENREGH